MNPAAILELHHTAEEAGDLEAANSHLDTLERLAASDAGAAFAAALAFQHGRRANSGKHHLYLERSATLGLPAAQLELAASYAFGLNGFPEDVARYELWIARAREHLPELSAELSKRVQNRT